mmetsp:Transcript_48894/g.163164  ORF Transcript_48894/g.163164 Transcript_48894/m.163164 type:complete len:297 (-) Transcript_48894:29-919(-)
MAPPHLSTTRSATGAGGNGAIPLAAAAAGAASTTITDLADHTMRNIEHNIDLNRSGGTGATRPREGAADAAAVAGGASAAAAAAASSPEGTSRRGRRPSQTPRAASSLRRARSASSTSGAAPTSALCSRSCRRARSSRASSVPSRLSSRSCWPMPSATSPSRPSASRGCKPRMPPSRSGTPTGGRGATRCGAEAASCRSGWRRLAGGARSSVSCPRRTWRSTRRSRSPSSPSSRHPPSTTSTAGSGMPRGDPVKPRALAGLPSGSGVSYSYRRGWPWCVGGQGVRRVACECGHICS